MNGNVGPEREGKGEDELESLEVALLGFELALERLVRGYAWQAVDCANALGTLSIVS